MAVAFLLSSQTLFDSISPILGHQVTITLDGFHYTGSGGWYLGFPLSIYDGLDNQAPLLLTVSEPDTVTVTCTSGNLFIGTGSGFNLDEIICTGGVSLIEESDWDWEAKFLITDNGSISGIYIND